jgi:hypothetical protein
MKNFAINREARLLAEKLLTQAKENEPQITADLQNIAAEVSAEIVGLENKFKSKESLTRKLIDSAGNDLQKLRRKIKRINDAMRYTFVLPIETYAENFFQTIEKLQSAGYAVPERRIWNAWNNVGTAKDRGYRGINVTIISSENQEFELQFHTEASFKLKTETHFLYKELRDKNIAKEREIELISVLKKAAANVKRPRGV